MREIRFRAWDKRAKAIVGQKNDVRDYFSIRSDGMTNDDYVLMQYTGLHDSKGKEIWEGDILKSKWRADPYVIIFQDGSFRGSYQWQTKHDLTGFHFDSREAENGEVIGNIYENVSSSQRGSARARDER